MDAVKDERGQALVIAAILISGVIASMLVNRREARDAAAAASADADPTANQPPPKPAG